MRKACGPDGRKEAKLSEAEQAHMKKREKAHKKSVVGGKTKSDSQAPPRVHTSPQANAISCKLEGRKEVGW